MSKANINFNEMSDVEIRELMEQAQEALTRRNLVEYEELAHKIVDNLRVLITRAESEEYSVCLDINGEYISIDWFRDITLEVVDENNEKALITVKV
jgi:hypothetical protein